ncbi:MAG: cupin domain-containing protein [Gaiellaceae bacterium]
MEHTLAPGTLAAPMHEHVHEDEYTIVLEGRVDALLGDELVHASEGEVLAKPRGQRHTFWNAGDSPARVHEIICPAGFEGFFFDLADTLDERPRLRELRQLCRRYDVKMHFETVPGLLETYGLTQAPAHDLDLIRGV